MRWFVILLILFSTSVYGQDDLFEQAIPRHAVRVSPFHLMSFYPTIQLGYETKIKSRLTLYMEGGYAVPLNQSDSRFIDKRGYKAKIEPRYYAAVSKKANFLHYYAAELYRNAINFDREDTRVECFDLECRNMFRRNYFYKVKYRENGFGLKTGMMLYRKNFFFDFNGGIALRFINYIYPSALEEEMAALVGVWSAIPNERDRRAIMPITGIRIGYRLK